MGEKEIARRGDEKRRGIIGVYVVEYAKHFSELFRLFGEIGRDSGILFFERHRGVIHAAVKPEGAERKATRRIYAHYFSVFRRDANSGILARKLSSGGIPDDEYVVCINKVFILIAYRPLHHGVHILKRSGKNVLRRKAIVKIDNREAPLGEGGAVVFINVCVSVNVASAVKADYRGKGETRTLRVGNVQVVFRTAGVLNTCKICNVFGYREPRVPLFVRSRAAFSEH